MMTIADSGPSDRERKGRSSPVGPVTRRVARNQNHSTELKKFSRTVKAVENKQWHQVGVFRVFIIRQLQEEKKEGGVGGIKNIKKFYKNGKFMVN